MRLNYNLCIAEEWVLGQSKVVNWPTDFDGAWKEALEQFFRPFLEFCFPDIAARVDWSKGFYFLDKELQKVVHDAEMGTLRVDKLVQVYRLDGIEDWLLVHVEVQSQTDNDLPWRMYQYYHRIADRYKKKVVSLAVLADEQASWRPQVYEETHWGCKLRFEYLICKLQDYNRTPDELGADLNPMAVVVAAHFAAMATRGDVDKRFNLKWQLTRNLYERGYSKQEVLNLYRLIDWVMTMPEDMDLAFERKIVDYEKENSMPFITSIERIGIKKGIERGMEKGMEKGIEKGRQEGQASLIVRMLKRRLGTLDPELEMRLLKLSLSQLESFGERILDFGDVSALQRWLNDDAK